MTPGEVERKVRQLDNDMHSIYEMLSDISVQQSHQLTKFDVLETRIDAHDARFDAIDTRFNGVDTKLEAIDTRFNGVDTKLEALGGKLDQIIERLP